MSFPLGAWCPFLGNGERERRTGTKLLAVFLQHICTNVNTKKDECPKRCNAQKDVMARNNQAFTEG